MDDTLPVLDNFQERAYVAEIRRQCAHALNALIHVDEAMKAKQEIARSETPNIAAANGWHMEVFRNLHSFLTHASNVSRLLFPPRRDGNKRAEHLRSLLGVDDTNPLKSRTLRDHLDHYDERLDEWRSKHRTIISDTIGPRDTTFAGLDLNAALRWYDPSTQMFWFRAEAFDIRELAEATRALYERSKLAEDDLHAEMMRKIREEHGLPREAE
jgi:hypothetical protein